MASTQITIPTIAPVPMDFLLDPELFLLEKPDSDVLDEDGEETVVVVSGLTQTGEVSMFSRTPHDVQAISAWLNAVD